MTSERNFPTDKYYDLTATIALGQTVSEAIDLQGLELVGLFLPATFDGSGITLLAAPAMEGAFVPVQDGAGAAFTLSGAASQYVPVGSLSITAGLRYVKLVTASAQAGTDTVMTLALRPI